MADLDYINNLNISNKMLFLDGYGIDVRVDDGKLVIKDGNGVKKIFFPKRFPFTNIILYGTRGSLSFEAIRWLIKQDAQISFLNWNGKLLTTILPEEAKQTKLKFAQYECYRNSKRILIAKSLLEAKFLRTRTVLSWLRQKYSHINDNIEKETSRLTNSKSIDDMLMIEGRVARIYWRELSRIFNKKFEFENRKTGKTEKPMGAVDPINALFNYGYSILESECRKSINSVGLDTHVGFLHEVTLGKEPLVYDLQEPFRWIIDVTIINALEKNVFEKKDFIRTENYNIKLRSSGAKKLTKELESQFNKIVLYLGKKDRLSHIILLKTRELAQYLLGRFDSINFTKPIIQMNRTDNLEVRRKILSLTNSQARKLGIGKSELWYLKQKAKSEKPFKIYKSVEKKLKYG